MKIEDVKIGDTVGIEVKGMVVGADKWGAIDDTVDLLVTYVSKEGRRATFRMSSVPVQLFHTVEQPHESPATG